MLRLRRYGDEIGDETFCAQGESNRLRRRRKCAQAASGCRSYAFRALALGISHQQLQKYETGANRISAGMLYELARFFAQPVDALYEGIEDPETEDTGLVRSRRKCHAIVERTYSREKLELMAKVIRSISTD